MGSARLAEAADQGVGRRLEPEDPGGDAPLLEAHDDPGEIVQVGSLTDVDHEGDVADRIMRAGNEIREDGDEGHGEVVDAKVPEVLEDSRRERFSGPGEPRD